MDLLEWRTIANLHKQKNSLINKLGPLMVISSILVQANTLCGLMGDMVHEKWLFLYITMVSSVGSGMWFMESLQPCCPQVRLKKQMWWRKQKPKRCPSDFFGMQCRPNVTTGQGAMLHVSGPPRPLCRAGLVGMESLLWDLQPCWPHVGPWARVNWVGLRERLGPP